MDDEATVPPDEPVREVSKELGRLSRELSSLADTQPLLSTAINAQLRKSLAPMLNPILPAYPRDAFQAVTEQLRKTVAFDTSILRASLENAIFTPGLRKALETALLPSFKSFTDPAIYAAPDPPKAAYSPAMSSPGDYFANVERSISSFNELNSAIVALIGHTPRLQLVWRGQRNADWGIHSGLFRRLIEINGVKPPNAKPKQKQPYPDEDQMVAAEREILRVARTDWRLDGLSALETFARIQHVGGPTRLLDVTKNPFIGAWFTVEQSAEEEGVDGRLIAFATAPVPEEPEDSAAPTQIGLDDEWGRRDPPWHGWTDASARQSVDWGTGALRRLWVPPAYDPRISAQNAAFILDGTPITSSKTQPYFKSSIDRPHTYWSRADVLAAASIFVKTFSPNRKPRANKHNLAPTFTFRVKAEAKAQIREFLAQRFGYTRSYIYPDVAALADHVRNMELPKLGA